ncbi:nucleotidyltransferase domain-containing protein [bacterium]|nr:nucleotidyltransferase domain-containing protein [bacterium]
MIDNQTLQTITDTIVEIASPQTIVLFGSEAREKSTDSSDVDLLVVAKQPFSSGAERRKQLAAISYALKDIPVDKDILLYSQRDVDVWKDARNHVIARAFREGRVLYG